MHHLIEEELINMGTTVWETAQSPLSIQRMCELLGVNRSYYYRQHCQSSGSGGTGFDEEILLRDQIQRIVLDMPGYGYRRVTKELQRRGYQVNHKRILRLMRKDNLLCLRRRRFWAPATTDSRHDFPCYPNLVPELSVTDINQLWVADITYIRLVREFVYLAVILDAFSRRVIGWALEDYLDSRLTLAALEMALSGRRFNPGLVHHSDRGVQYACDKYTELLKAHRIRISMSRRAAPYDNPQAESFMKTLKAEEVHLSEYQTKREARQRIGRFLEDVYNSRRLHSALDYVPPAEFEENLAIRQKSAVSTAKVA